MQLNILYDSRMVESKFEDSPKGELEQITNDDENSAGENLWEGTDVAEFEDTEGFRIEYENGDVYEGETSDQKRNGRGEMHYASGFSFEGIFVDDQRQAFGILKSPDGNPVFKGEWSNDTFDGRGWLRNIDADEEITPDEPTPKFSYKDFTTLGSRWRTYEGEFTLGLWDGIGTLVLQSGECYAGSFLNGKVDGSGTFTFKDGKKISGFWKEDKLKFTL